MEWDSTNIKNWWCPKRTWATLMDKKLCNVLCAERNSMPIMKLTNFNSSTNAGIRSAKSAWKNMLKTNSLELMVFLHAHQNNVKIQFHNTKLKKFLDLNSKFCKIKSWAEWPIWSNVQDASLNMTSLQVIPMMLQKKTKVENL